MVEGYTRVPDDDEFDGLAEASIRSINEDGPWWTAARCGGSRSQAWAAGRSSC
jgi:hypothetical protein